MNPNQINDINKTIGQINQATGTLNPNLTKLPTLGDTSINNTIGQINQASASLNPSLTQLPMLGNMPESTVVNATDINATNRLKIPTNVDQTSIQATQLATPIAAGADMMAQLQQQQRDEAAKMKETTTSDRSALDSIMAQLGMKGQTQVAQEQAAGLPQMQQELVDINNQMQQVELAYRRQLEDLPNLGVTDVQRSQAGREIQRKRATELADLAILQNAKTNNIAVAQQLVNRKIDLQFGDLENQLNYRMQFYKENKDELSKKEQRVFELQTAQIQNDLATKKDNAKTINDLYIEAASNGAPNDIAKQIANAPTVQKAQELAAPYIGRLEREKTYADIMKTRADSMASSLGGGDSSQLIAYAQQYASTGQIPTGLPKGAFGSISMLAKELPKPEGDIVDVNTGVKSAKISAAQLDGLAALRDLSKKLEDAKSEFSGLTTGLVGGTLGNISPTEQRQRYNILKSEIVDLLSRARSGAALTETEIKTYSNKLPGTFNKTFWLGGDGEVMLEGLKKSIESKLDTTLRANGATMYGFSKVNLGGNQYTVGDIIDINGIKARVNPDGTVTTI